MIAMEISPGKWIGKDHPCFVVAEIGQNHQGDIEIAKQMVKMVKDCGVDCVKFQKCKPHEKFTRKALERPYNSIHSWGSTYGEHKAYLEFNEDQFKELKKYADGIGILFSASAGDEVSFDFLDSIGVQFFKIASPDAGNFELVKHVAIKGKPLIISTGMQEMETIRKMYGILKNSKREFALLQCTSAYPVPPEDVNLRVLQNYQQEFPDVVIGYSGHEMGIAISVAAVAMGAKIVERHVTLDHEWKGNDHGCSLEPSELRMLVQDIRTVEKAMGCYEKRQLSIEMPCYRKLGKSIVAVTDLKEGDILCNSSIAVKVADRNGVSPEKRAHVLGKILKRSIEKDEPVCEDDIDWLL